MNFHPINVTLHIVMAGIWLSYFIIENRLKVQIKNSNTKEAKILVVKQYLNVSRLFILLLSLGVTVTGILLVVFNSHYGFFNMSNNHWLATKQILFVIILVNVFVNLLPSVKKVTRLIEQNSAENEYEKSLRKIFKANLLINILALLNFLFAITHKFYS